MDRLLDYARELKKEFETQDHDCQAHPRFWVIGDYCWDTRMEGDHDEYLVCLPSDDFYSEVSTVFIDKWKSKSNEELEETRGIECAENFIREIKEIECDVSLLDFVHKYFDEAGYLCPVAEEHFVVPNTFFLTKQDAKTYLQKYGYNHSPKAHTYAMTAIRSPKFQKLIDLIMEVE